MSPNRVTYDFSSLAGSSTCSFVTIAVSRALSQAQVFVLRNCILMLSNFAFHTVLDRSFNVPEHQLWAPSACGCTSTTTKCAMWPAKTRFRVTKIPKLPVAVPMPPPLPPNLLVPRTTIIRNRRTLPLAVSPLTSTHTLTSLRRKIWTTSL